MSFILPTMDYAIDLNVWASEYCRTRNLECPPVEKCVDAIIALVDDILAEKMVWCEKQNKFDEELSKIFPWYTSVSNEATDRNSSDFYYHVLDHVFLKVHNVINEHIPETKTWKVLYFQRRGSDVFIEEGEDYRILDWTRRMQNGEWKDGE